MEEHTHKDNLDEFIRRSFEQYEEDPSPLFWDKLSGQIPGQPVAGVFWLRRFGWQLTAAAVVLILSSALTIQYVHFTRQIKALVADQNALLEEMGNRQPVPANPAFEQNPAVDNLQQATGNKIVAQRQKELSGNKHASTLAFTTKTSGIEQVPTDGIPQPLASASAVNAVRTERSLPLFPLPYLPLTAFPGSSYEPNVLIVQPVNPIKPVKKASWYTGVHSTVSVMTEKLNNNKPFPEPDDNHHNQHRVVSSRSKINHTVTDYWLKAGKAIAPHFKLETGLGYQQFNRIAEHQPDLKIRDGRPTHGHGGPGGPGGPSHGHDEYDFNYTLNSYAGAMDINLRMAQVDTNATYPENEPLDLKLTTRETVKTLRIPLLLAAHADNGRFSFSVKGGLVGNIFLQNELEVTGISAAGDRFKRSNQDEPIAQKESAQRFGLDALLAAGVEYRLNNQLSLIAEPTFSTSLALQDNKVAPTPSYQTVGMNIGLNYRF